MKSFKHHIKESLVLMNLIDKHDDPFSFLAAAMDAIANGTLKLKTRGLANARELIAAWNKSKKRKIKLKEAVYYIAEARTIYVKGWIKSGKFVTKTTHFTHYHILQVVSDPSKFGLNKNKILKLLEAEAKSMDAPDPKAYAKEEYDKLYSGTRDNDEYIEKYLAKKGYCKFVIDRTHASIEGWDEKTCRAAAKVLDDEYLPFEMKGFKLFEVNPYRPLRPKYITSKYEWYEWLDGKKAAGKRTKIGSTMAQFREETLKEKAIVCGDCFKWANDWNIDHHSKTAKHKVVHGLVTGGPSSKTFPHAWIEDKGKVYDTNVGNKGIDLKRFYKTLNARDTVKYTPTEATRLWFKKGHNGPWDKSFDKWPTTK